MKKSSIIILSIILFACKNTPDSFKVRESALAGKWYSADSKTLSKTIDDLLMQPKLPQIKIKKPKIFILPHAGYRYSGKIAASGYKLIEKLNPDLVIIIAPSHHLYLQGASVPEFDFYKTPLGKVKVDRDIADKLLKNDLINSISEAHTNEHSIEIHLPFLQRIFKDKLKKEIPIVPIIIGDLPGEDAKKIALTITDAVKNKKNPIFIISSDFTHYGPNFNYRPFKNNNANIIKKKIHMLDHQAIDLIIKKDLKNFISFVEKTKITICGRNPIKVALAMELENFNAKKISYDTSGNITGDFSNSVSYAAIAIGGELKKNKTGINLSPGDKKFLLGIARKNIESFLEKKRPMKLEEKGIPENLKLKRGAFVTLKKNKHLRGCIGHIMSNEKLYKTILACSYSAAFRDPRFNPLEKNELKNIEIEISILTLPEPVSSVNEIIIGVDGLIIHHGMNRGVLLPQVASEYGWDLEKYLENISRKAGLPVDAWKDKNTKLYKFQALVFNEEI